MNEMRNPSTWGSSGAGSAGSPIPTRRGGRGETAELEWTFTEPGRYQFACHVPGHFEAGMVIEVEVVA